MSEIRRQMSMRDFSRQIGVSPATVSRVFSNPDAVAGGTREWVLKEARKAGFRPSPVTRSAIGKSTRSIGVLVPDLSVSFFADIARGVQAALLAEDYLPVVLSNDGEDGLRGVQRMIDHRVDALIFGVSDEAISQADLVAITGEKFPLIVVDQPHPGFEYDTVLSDDELGGFQAGEHLAGLGHRRVGCVHYGEGTSNCEARIAGCRRALAAVGGEMRPADVVQVPVHGEEDVLKRTVVSELERMLGMPDQPTAVFATTDLFARDVMLAARRLGLRIPDDLSVVGFADLNFADLTDPPLTTIRQNGLALGRQAAEMAMKRIAEPERECCRTVIPTRLVVRGTTATAP